MATPSDLTHVVSSKPIIYIYIYLFIYIYIYIYNGNCTEWSAIWVDIIRVVSKSNERTARVRFEITSMISDQNCTTQGSITTLLYPF